MSDWKSKYEAEERNLLAILRRIYALTHERNRLQWKLDRCRHPHDTRPSAPLKADKSELLRIAEADKLLVADVPRSKSEWEKAYRKLVEVKQEHRGIRGHITSEIRRLRKELAMCRSAQGDHAEAASLHRDTRSTVPEKKEVPARGPAFPGRVGLSRHEEPAAQLEALREDNRQLRQAMRVLEEEKQAFKRQKEQWVSRRKTQEKNRDADKKKIDELQEAYAVLQRRFHALKQVRTLAESLQQGQRTFLDQHNNPLLDNALAGLVDYALAQLALALAEGQEAGEQAMFYNLYIIAARLQTYNQRIVHGFDAAVAWLQAQNVARYAEALPPSAEQLGPEAKPFQVRLKYLRDVARVDLRPFYYIDDQGQVQRIG